MSVLTADTERRVQRIPADLKAEFPDVPSDVLEHDVDEGARELIENARFTDFVPVLIHRSVREQLLARN